MKINSNSRKMFLSIALFIGALATTVIVLEASGTYTESQTIHQDAPVITRKSITINAPVAQVWKIFTDVDHWSDWQKEIGSPKINGEFKEGTTFNWKSNGLTITSTLQTVKVNEVIGWSGPAFGAFAIHTWYFTEKNGKTTIRVEESMEGWLVGMVKNMFQSGLDKSIDNWLQYLKTESEL
jgi:uncharacterized membrane protein